MTAQPDAAERAEWLRQQREGWSAAAPSWDEWFDAFEEFAAPLTLELLAQSGVGAGAEVLDIGCGNGVPAIAAARFVGAKGRVVGIDLAAPMIEHARRRAAAVGAPNVEFLALGAEDVAGLGPFDAAYSRFALMLVPDPAAAARAIRGALRPGARFAACVWGGEGEVPFCSIAPHVLRDTLDVAPAQPDAPGPLRLGRPGQLIDVLRAAGFVDVADVTRRVEPRFASVADAVRFYCEGSGSVRRALDGHGAEDRARFVAGFERALTAYRRDDGSVVMPSIVRIASGRVG